MSPTTLRYHYKAFLECCDRDDAAYQAPAVDLRLHTPPVAPVAPVGSMPRIASARQPGISALPSSPSASADVHFFLGQREQAAAV